MSTTRLSNLDLVKACDNFPYDAHPEPLYTLNLPHDSRPRGYLFKSNVSRMPWTSDFTIDHSARTVTVHDSSNGADPSATVTQAFATVINTAISNNTFRTLNAQNSELYPILGAPYPVQLERFAAGLFGITTRGAHLTVYTTTTSGEMKIWVPRRSPHLFTYPDKLDSTVAGGVSAGETPWQNVIREAGEEASLPAEMVERGVKAGGVLTYISYHLQDPDGTGMESSITPDVVYVYDLEVGGDFQPAPRDGEVKDFTLMGVGEVREALGRGEFKTNSAVVMVDFLVRHGVITAEEERDYVEVVERMHRRLPFPVVL